MTLTKQKPNAPVPWLENGDHLSRREFERLYEQTTDQTKAELIQGIVYMASPVRIDLHAEQDNRINTWIGNYSMFTPGVKAATNGSFRIDDWNEPQPDAVLFLPKKSGGHAEVDEEGFLTGIPELIIEVSNSSKSIDLNAKKKVYREHGVKEYIVWRVLDDMIEWFVHQNDSYHPLEADAEGVLRSQAFPGLWLNVPAMLRGDLLEVFATLQKGCATPEHRKYVEAIGRTQPT
ncbi:MAG: Uma2 family endonuclease [Gemmatales bacterium]